MTKTAENTAKRTQYEEIITMDWMFANIVGEIPEKYELKEQAKPIVELQGVKGEKE